MAIPITVPRLGWSMDEGNFAGWLKSNGDRVDPGDRLFALESEKATQEVEAIDGGILCILPQGPKQGGIVLVGQLLGYLLAVGEPAPNAEPAEDVDDDTVGFSRSATDIRPEPAGAGPGGRPASGSERAISPRALRVATELGVDWTQLIGSGRDGRVREQDVRAAAAAAAGTPAPPVDRAPSFTSSTRRIIAQRVSESARNTVPVTLHTTADAAHLVTLRERLKAEAHGTERLVPGYTDLIVKAVARTLREQPGLNARWEKEELKPSTRIHVSIAVETEAGVLTPVLRDADTLSLEQIAAQSKALIDAARARRLTPPQMRDGTFTVSSLGSVGVDHFTPVINYPECAVLGVGRILRQPVVIQDYLQAREVISLSLTFDHRAMDGAPAGRFLQALCQRLADPDGL